MICGVASFHTALTSPLFVLASVHNNKHITKAQPIKTDMPIQLTQSLQAPFVAVIEKQQEALATFKTTRRVETRELGF